jgi:hypothetical protein
MVKKNVYLAIFDSKNFYGVSLDSEVNAIVSTSPEAAIYNIVRKNLPNSLSQDGKTAVASTVRKKLAAEGGLGKLIFNIEDEVMYDDSTPINENNPDYLLTITSYLASDIENRKGKSKKESMDIAREGIKKFFYLKSLNQ